MPDEKLCPIRKVITPVLDSSGYTKYEENFLLCVKEKCAFWREYINGEGICALTDIAESFTRLLDSMDDVIEEMRRML